MWNGEGTLASPAYFVDSVRIAAKEAVWNGEGTQPHPGDDEGSVARVP